MEQTKVYTYLTYKRRNRKGENEIQPHSQTTTSVVVVDNVPHNRMHYREPLLDSPVEDLID